MALQCAACPRQHNAPLSTVARSATTSSRLPSLYTQFSILSITENNVIKKQKEEDEEGENIKNTNVLYSKVTHVQEALSVVVLRKKAACDSIECSLRGRAGTGGGVRIGAREGLVMWYWSDGRRVVADASCEEAMFRWANEVEN